MEQDEHDDTEEMLLANDEISDIEQEWMAGFRDADMFSSGKASARQQFEDSL